MTQETERQIIDALGGASKVGRALNKTPQAVTNWKVRGIPRAIEVRRGLVNLARVLCVEIDTEYLMGEK
jgi:hypothetical protein